MVVPSSSPPLNSILNRLCQRQPAVVDGKLPSFMACHPTVALTLYLFIPSLVTRVSPFSIVDE